MELAARGGEPGHLAQLLPRMYANRAGCAARYEYQYAQLHCCACCSVVVPVMFNIRVLVCGGRYYADREFVYTTLDRVHQERNIVAVISGGKLEGERWELARGADKWGLMWAKGRGIPRQEFPAPWLTLGKRAGFARNKQMRDEGKPDLVIAFPGHVGTANMVSLAVEQHIPVWLPTGTHSATG